MFDRTDIVAKAWLTREVVNLALRKDNFEVDKIFLIGSYAQNKADEWSDIDFLVQLKDIKQQMIKRYYPGWDKMQEVQQQLSKERIHVIFGNQEAQDSLFKKRGIKYTYKPVDLDLSVRSA